MSKRSKWRPCIALVVVCVSASSRAALAQNAVYYSVGTSTADLKSGSPTVSITGGVATFSTAQPDFVGVGD